MFLTTNMLKFVKDTINRNIKRIRSIEVFH